MCVAGGGRGRVAASAGGRVPSRCPRRDALRSPGAAVHPRRHPTPSAGPRSGQVEVKGRTLAATPPGDARASARRPEARHAAAAAGAARAARRGGTPGRLRRGPVGPAALRRSARVGAIRRGPPAGADQQHVLTVSGRGAARRGGAGGRGGGGAGTRRRRPSSRRSRRRPYARRPPPRVNLPSPHPPARRRLATANWLLGQSNACGYVDTFMKAVLAAPVGTCADPTAGGFGPQTQPITKPAASLPARGARHAAARPPLGMRAASRAAVLQAARAVTRAATRADPPAPARPSQSTHTSPKEARPRAHRQPRLAALLHRRQAHQAAAGRGGHLPVAL
jgi:hypothetical protein